MPQLKIEVQCTACERRRTANRHTERATSTAGDTRGDVGLRFPRLDELDELMPNCETEGIPWRLCFTKRAAGERLGDDEGCHVTETVGLALSVTPYQGVVRSTVGAVALDGDGEFESLKDLAVLRLVVEPNYDMVNCREHGSILSFTGNPVEHVDDD